jgi:hypothetical protein
MPFSTVTDVSVRFTTSTFYELTLQDAMTFWGASGGGTPSPTTTVPRSSGGTPTTTLARADSGAGGGGGGAVTTTTVSPAPVPTVPPATSPTTPTTSVPGGGLRLRPVSATTPLALLSPTTWPRPGCVSSTCHAATL